MNKSSEPLLNAVLGLLFTFLSSASMQAQPTMANQKLKVGKDHYVVMRPGTDTIFGVIKEMGFNDSKITKLNIASKKKRGDFSKTELNNIIAFKYGNVAKELVDIQNAQQKKEKRWLQVFNSGDARLLLGKQSSTFQDQKEDVQVTYKLYYWRVGDSVFPITESLLRELIVPSINECAGSEVVELGSAEDKEYLLELTKLWNAHFDCISISDLN